MSALVIVLGTLVATYLYGSLCRWAFDAWFAWWKQGDDPTTPVVRFVPRSRIYDVEDEL